MHKIGGDQLAKPFLLGLSHLWNHRRNAIKKGRWQARVQPRLARGRGRDAHTQEARPPQRRPGIIACACSGAGQRSLQAQADGMIRP